MGMDKGSPETTPASQDFVRIGYSIVNLHAVAYATRERCKGDLVIYLKQKDEKGKRLFVRPPQPLASEVEGFFIGRTAREWMPKEYEQAKVDVPQVQTFVSAPSPAPLTVRDDVWEERTP
jgi:hypothetical protein